MIPAFPQFRPLCADDKSYVDSFTKSYKPYSDFVFSNLWIWNIEDKCKISALNGNLVVLFYEYATKESFLSFLGTNEVDKTIHTLYAYAKENGCRSTFNFMPEETVLHITDNSIRILEDPDDFDYIYSTSELATLTGYKYKNNRHLVNQFTRAFPTATYIQKDIRLPEVQAELIELMQKNRAKKMLSEKSYYFKFEEIAFSRALKLSEIQPLLLSCVYLDKKLIGYSVDEVIQKEYALSHFFIVDYSYTGVYDFLNTKTASYLSERGVQYWNWAEDLGIANLRKTKLAYRPVDFIKMFSLEII
jgi:uncharacterized protein